MENPVPKKTNTFLKYSGIAFELAGILGVFVFLGSRLDIYFQTSKPFITVVFSLFGLAVGFYISLKDFFVKKDK